MTGRERTAAFDTGARSFDIKNLKQVAVIVGPGAEAFGVMAVYCEIVASLKNFP